MKFEKFKEILISHLNIFLSEKLKSKISNTYCFYAKKHGFCVDLKLINQVQTSFSLQSAYDNINIGINYEDDA